ncbi:hypothetical protein V2E24_01125 [Mycoplasmopsis ciconiae]|uniref:Transmembrane protein n=1 Tax=Mycoplasmopsis ciconiae TaxID=561067 RepID=A0ABU7MKX1_9BACT|nr:hypothetical protein [Mycoplasmopsis ciconiae]
MKIRKNRWLILSASLVPLSAFSFVISANETETTTNNNQNPDNNDASDEETKTISPDFDTFKEKAAEKIKIRLETLLVEIKKTLNQQVLSLNETIDKIAEADFKPTLAKLIYYQKFIQYFDKNKDKIVNDFSDSALNPTFLNVLSSVKNYYKADITLLDEDYNPIIFSKDNPQQNYDQIVKKYNGQINDVTPKTSENVVTLEELEKTINDYYDAYNTELEKILTNKDDLPKLEEIKFSNNEEDKQYLDLKVPENYANWDEYFKEKLQLRNTIFDIEQNKNYTQEKQPPTPTPAEDPSKNPPIVVDDSQIDKQLNKIIQENISRLPAYIDVNAFNISPINLINEFKQDPIEFNKKGYLVFENSILSRFDYQLVNLENVEGHLVATAKIYDRLSKSFSAEYKVNVIKRRDESVQIKYNIYNKILSNLFKNFYEALGIGDMMLFSSLSNKDISLSVYRMIYVAVQLINKEEYKNQLKQIIANDTSVLNNLVNQKINSDFESLKTNDLTSDLVSQLSLLVNKSLSNSLINGNTFFNFLAVEYDKVFRDQFIQYIRVNKEKILDQFRLLRLDPQKLENAVQTTRKDISYLRGITSENNYSDSHIENIFSKYKTIQSQIYNLGVVSTTTYKNFSEDAQIQEKYKTAYNNLIVENKFVITANKILLIILGSIILLFSLILSAISALMYKFKRSKIIQKTNSKIWFSLAISGVSFVIGIIILVLGLI